jgi:hypothetical protein
MSAGWHFHQDWKEVNVNFFASRLFVAVQAATFFLMLLNRTGLSRLAPLPPEQHAPSKLSSRQIAE